MIPWDKNILNINQAGVYFWSAFVIAIIVNIVLLKLIDHYVGAQRGSIPRFGGKRGNHDASKECLFA